MGGFFGVTSKNDCVLDLFYGTDYHSHLGTRRGGLALLNSGFTKFIHNIENAQFRSKFEDDINRLSGNMGIGSISDTAAQPLIIGSHLGKYAIVTVGKINNSQELIDEAFGKRRTHFLELDGGEINPTELVATLINQKATFIEGINWANQIIEGSCSLLLLTQEGIYAARDRYGRTPVIIGEKEGAFSVTLETCALTNLEYHFAYELGPGEIVMIDQNGFEQKSPPNSQLKICAFLWIYYGYPASSYEGRNVEVVRYRCGAALAQRDDVNVDVDMVAGIPDSGIAHAVGYANKANIAYCRPFVKYTPTWPRSFMPQQQEVRDLVARMKLIPIRELIHDKKLLFCEDSIVRGTQLRETIQRLYDHGAREVHMRPACPPLLHSCPFLNFSRSKSELDLAGQRAVREINKDGNVSLEEYENPDSEAYQNMVERIRNRLNLTTLKYQRLDDMLEAIDLPRENVCTYCWNAQG